jgi:hypothetical protein
VLAPGHGWISDGRKRDRRPFVVRWEGEECELGQFRLGIIPRLRYGMPFQDGSFGHLAALTSVGSAPRAGLRRTEPHDGDAAR